MTTLTHIIHYTSTRAWDAIQKEGLLRPKTQPYSWMDLPSEEVKRIAGKDSYLVGMERPNDERWLEYGLMKDIQRWCGEVTLRVPILQTDGAFVRDHALLSPKRFLDENGRDIWKVIVHRDPLKFDKDVKKRDWKIFDYANYAYVGSTTPLSDYQDQFKVPEFWIPQETPVALIERIT